MNSAYDPADHVPSTRRAGAWPRATRTGRGTHIPRPVLHPPSASADQCAEPALQRRDDTTRRPRRAGDDEGRGELQDAKEHTPRDARKLAGAVRYASPLAPPASWTRGAAALVESRVFGLPGFAVGWWRCGENGKRGDLTGLWTSVLEGSIPSTATRRAPCRTNSAERILDTPVKSPRGPTPRTTGRGTHIPRPVLRRRQCRVAWSEPACPGADLSSRPSHMTPAAAPRANCRTRRRRPAATRRQLLRVRLPSPRPERARRASVGSTLVSPVAPCRVARARRSYLADLCVARSTPTGRVTTVARPVRVCVATCLLHRLEFHPVGLRHAAGGIEDLDRHQIARRIEVENDPGTRRIAFRDGLPVLRTTLSVSVRGSYRAFMGRSSSTW